ncbi:hypothetical protein [Streptomyces sp. BRA346]|uniref:hypothetical protein n=1 Tax=Streptomyces sp. BRA346 TaxID=2878199 RepID=UPI004063F4A7
MTNTVYPTPSFQYQGAALTLSSFRLGPVQLGTARALGTNYATNPTLKIPDIRIRPVSERVQDRDPCTTSFAVYYTQYRTDPSDGREYRMVFRVTSDRRGGVIGTGVSLDVDSNYPEIDMAIPRFTFEQPGFGMLKEEVLPADYQATLTVRVWNGEADIALDGWLMLECGYYRNGERGASETGSSDSSDLIAVGRASLFPSCSTGSRVLGDAYRTTG